jgi:hypothetical protein
MQRLVSAVFTIFFANNSLKVFSYVSRSSKIAVLCSGGQFLTPTGLITHPVRKGISSYLPASRSSGASGCTAGSTSPASTSREGRSLCEDSDGGTRRRTSSSKRSFCASLSLVHTDSKNYNLPIYYIFCTPKICLHLYLYARNTGEDYIQQLPQHQSPELIFN